ncbi:PEPxxWA-CTERM sorting domain-containing protein [Sphingomonas abaci]|uniref:Ice-binding protein C-terminal domain-containing protein n=1 Tax=Sphingomonas abaci TaxID=237611 RepID=A0A7W7AJ56_9SPHN|nr:PEPxxWA-CTERM sorting domain-containing protein [Sphingomonas abaci]MBB4618010.1 hypothetical protein [Sphingomonas abaci]
MIINRMLAGALTAMVALTSTSAAQAATGLTVKITAVGEGYERPFPTTDFDYKRSFDGTSFAISLFETDDANVFVRIIQDVVYTATFQDAGLSITTSYQGTMPFPQVTAQTCYSRAGSATQGFNPPCGSYNLVVSFGGPPVAYFDGAAAIVSVEEGDTIGGNGVEYAIGIVPEPATWALMLTGFALTGYALRRRRVAFA